MPTETELTLEQTQQGVSYEVSYDESNTYVLERFNTTAGNLVKKILLKLNLSDHRLILIDLKEYLKMVMEENLSSSKSIIHNYIRVFTRFSFLSLLITTTMILQPWALTFEMRLSTTSKIDYCMFLIYYLWPLSYGRSGGSPASSYIASLLIDVPLYNAWMVVVKLALVVVG
ncbi:hypothetical protein Tco_1213156 [Tanacetum coccineum]